MQILDLKLIRGKALNQGKISSSEFYTNFVGASIANLIMVNLKIAPVMVGWARLHSE